MKLKLSLFIIISMCLLACSNDNILMSKSEQADFINSVNQLTSTLEELETTVNKQLDDLSTIANDFGLEDSSNEKAPTGDTITTPDDYDYVLVFPSDDYPETALHIYGAIEQGYTDVCTIDRDGADDNRSKSLKGIPTMEGYDRDEWPMAMCAEGGSGASVAYISVSDNRGAGSWVGHQLSQYEDGERILFIVEKPTKLFPEDVTN